MHPRTGLREAGPGWAEDPHWTIWLYPTGTPGPSVRSRSTPDRGPQSRGRGWRYQRDNPAMALTPGTELLLAALVVAFIGAVLGSVGFTATIGRRQLHRITAVTEALAGATDPAYVVQTDGLHDPKLRAAFGRLADRVSDTWTLATVDPLTGVANRQSADRPDRGGAGAGQPLRPAAVDRARRPRPLQARQRRPRPLGRRHGPARVRADARGQRPGGRHRRPLRRRGVHAGPARDRRRRRGHDGREAPPGRGRPPDPA